MSHKRYVILLLTALVAVLAWPVSRPANALDQRDMEDCSQSVDADRRISGCTRVLEARGQKPRSRSAAYNNRGSAYLAKGDQERALADFAEALRADPQNAFAYANRGLARYIRGEYDSAIADDNEAIRLNPKDAVPYSGRGSAYSALGDHDRALADQEEALRRQPQFAPAYYGRGVAYMGKGEYDRAIADFTETLRISPRFAAAYNSRGLVASIRGDPDRAIADSSEAIRIDPKFATAYNNRGSAYYEKADFDRALADLNEAIRISPKFAIASQHRADIYRIRGDYQRAIADYNEAIRIVPQFVVALAGRGLAYEATAEFSKARADFEAALATPQKPANEKLARDMEMARNKARERLAALPNSQGPERPVAPPAIVAATAAAGAVLASERRIALVIGNSAYENVPALANPTRDAALVADTLKRAGFEMVIVQPNLRKDALMSALRGFAARAETADWAVVYYAGHGMEVGGINYLVPVDARIAADRDIGFEAVPLQQVLDAAERARKLRLVILDACRDNPFVNQMKRTQTVASRSVTRGLAAIEPEAGTLVVYAAKDGETAIDGDGNNSPFALAFVKNLQTPGLEVRRLFDFVRDDVMEATGRRQKPFSYGSISGRQDFYFVANK